MQRREYLVAAGGAVAATALAGCTGGNGNGTDNEYAGDTQADGNGGASRGTLAMQVTDQPGDIGDFESCVVTITAVRVKPAGGDGGATATATSTDERTTDETVTNGTATNETDRTEDHETADADARGVQTHDVEDARADLVELQDGNTELVAELDLEIGEYRFLQLVVSEVEATLEGGGEAEVTTPGNAPMKFNESFEIRADMRTVFTADFTPVKRGKGDSYLLKPVGEGTEVEYEDDDSGTEDGTANGTETATVIDEEKATATTATDEERATATTDA